jgi:hypothetical protein
VKSASGSGRQVLDNDEIRGVTTELLDVLCYITELENKIDDLETQVKQNDLIKVEILGDNF